MPQLTSTENSPYSPQQLFDLVADVARYPEFLPWCRAARITARMEREFHAELVISFMHFTEKYTSRVQLHPSASANEAARIEVSLIRGPFEYLNNHWSFSAQAEGGTEIRLALDFKFKSRLLESLIGGVFERACSKMTAAFRERAAALYGNEILN